MSFLRRIFGKRLQAVPAAGSLAVQLPVLLPLRTILEKLQEAETNKYKFYQIAKELDPELFGVIDRTARLVRRAYRGIGVKFGKQLDEKEQRLLDAVKEFDRKWNIADFFQTAADRLLTYGDDVGIARFQNGVGLVEWRPLPLQALTAVEDESQIQNISAQVFQANIYILNEGLEGEMRFTKDQIYHISLNPYHPVRDIKGRYTFGVWSLSPLEALRHTILRKIAIQINDILLRQKLVPREHHKLDLSMFDPNLFEGETLEERIKKAKEAADKFLSEYSSKVLATSRDVDRSYVTGKEVEIGYVEPKHVTYIDPNPMLDQLNNSIMSVVAPLEAALRTQRGATYATGLLLAGTTDLVAETIAEKIKQTVLSIVRRHIRAKYPEFTDEDLAKIDIQLQLAYGIGLTELIRRIAILTATNCFATDEIRAMVGYPPLTEEQKEDIAQRIGRGRLGQYAQTLGDMLRDFIREREVSEPVTPESRGAKQET